MESFKIPSYQEYKTNEAVEFGGRMGKVHKELWDVMKTVVPEKFLKNINFIDPGSRSLPTPITIKGGQNNGYIQATQLEIVSSKKIGNKNINGIVFSIRKRTSGPGTGYIGIQIISGSTLLELDKNYDQGWAVKEITYWDDDELKEKFMELWHIALKYAKIRL